MSSKFFERLSPVSGKTASRALAMDVADAVAAAHRAQSALASWSEVGPQARRTLLLRAAAALEQKSEAIVDAMATELGATRAWAIGGVRGGAAMLREAASLTTQITGEVYPCERPNCIAMSVREPVGVVLGIAPWNAPVSLAIRSIALALACGNTVILKASELCPRTHLLTAEIFSEAGFPDGAVNLVTNAPGDGEAIVGALIDHEFVRRINFTGSTAVGRHIAVRAAHNLKPALLELGGKAPLIVLADADLDEAAAAAAFGAFYNQGQICMSTERIIVVEEVAEAFNQILKTRVERMTLGDPALGQTDLGAVVDERTAVHVQSLVTQASGHGAEIILGGTWDGVLVPPTILDKVTPEMRLFREESFGPVVGISRARDEEHAIELANDTEYGLTAAVFTRDAMRGLQVARRLKTGMCHVNGATVFNEVHMPFGGMKNSGYGRFGGKADVDFFTELRLITVSIGPASYPI